ncbi:hypothetical protein [Actinomadura atramentaria]|uniref:hypothetical protein n=1 Tax=Actinomadura atramentaria TaxID=1990 RepID=UPI00037780D1|nr:hypothetical protein [Actinomadura atramentaria]
MSGDLASGDRDDPARPRFLPPELPHGPWPAGPEERAAAAPEPARPAAPRESAPPREPAPPRGSHQVILPVLTLVAAVVMLVAAFLPWVRAEYTVDFLGTRIRHDAGGVAGIDADGTVLVVPVLALAAMLMTGWGLISRDARISGLAVVPGALSALGCGLFVLRLDRARQDLAQRDSLLGSFDVSLDYGWYLAVGAALLLTLFAAVRPVRARVAGRAPA